MGLSREKRKRDLALPTHFVPRFWGSIDGRVSLVKEIKRRYEELKEHCDADSHQKDLLCQRAVFVGVQLETMEITAADTGEFDPGVYAQMCNSLLGLLKTLGLERKMPKKTMDLKSYVGSNR